MGIVTVCMKCGHRINGVGDIVGPIPTTHKKLSHGLCKGCFKVYMDEIEARKQRVQGGNNE